MQQPAANDRLIGQTIGNYKVRQKLGEGGMGSVYMAEHPMIGKKVAVKVLHPEFATNENVVGRFFTEAKSVNDIQHPNIVDIIDYGVLTRDSLPNLVYFIMEFLDGESLTQIIRRDSPLPVQRSLAIIAQIADALSASHASGIVHRDLKPDNIILIQRSRQEDFVKVLDFGIAKLTGDHQGSKRTRTGIVMGTPAYMSPEQCEGRGNVDHRTDIYALGILLYELLTSRVPFSGQGYGEVLVQHLTQPPAPPTTLRKEISPHIESVCLKALEKKADARYPSMQEFLKAITDPVTYVDDHGGPATFTSANLGAPVLARAASAPISAPSAATLTPAPGQVSPVPGSPIPGQISPVPGLASPVPGQMSPVPGAALHTPVPIRPPTLLETRRGKMAAAIVSIVAIASLAIVLLLVIGRKPPNPSPAPPTAAGKPKDDQPTVKPKQTQQQPPANKQPITALPTPPVTPKPPVAKQPAEPPKDPAKPKTVRIAIVSSPSGAQVFVGSSATPRGTTPFTFEIPRAESKTKITLKMTGYKTWSKSIASTENSSFDINLVRKRSRTSSRPSRTSSRPSRSTKPPAKPTRPTPPPRDPGGRNFKNNDTRVMTPSFLRGDDKSKSPR